MKHFLSLAINKTFLRYFISYLVILTIACIGFYVSVQTNFKSAYFSQLNAQNQTILENLYELVELQFQTIDQINLSSQKNYNLLMSRYAAKNYSNYLAASELSKYNTGNHFINDTIYIDKTNDTIISSKRFARFDENQLEISCGNHFAALNISDLYASSIRRLFKIIAADGGSLILYVPAQDSKNCLYIYEINQYELNRLLETGLSSGISSIELNDFFGNSIIEIHKESSEDSSNLPLTVSNISLFQLQATINRPALLGVVNSALRSTYYFLTILGLFGFLIIFVVMQFTYRPLRNLAKNIASGQDMNRNYLDQIRGAFDDNKQEKELLEHKINDYRFLMQKSIFDSIIADNNQASNLFDQIDDLFNADENNALFIAIFFSNDNRIADFIASDLIKILPLKSVCVLLEKEDHCFVLLINYAGIERSKNEVLRMQLDVYAKKFSCKAALSHSTSNPMQIPSLYEKALFTSQYAQDHQVISYSEIASNALLEDSNYPYKILEKLTNAINLSDFDHIYEQLLELLDVIYAQNSSVFFVRCILIDILTILISNMNRCNVKFEKYRELYLQTLYFCRSCDCRVQKNAITENMTELLNIFKAEASSPSVPMKEVEDFVKQNFSSKDLSISMLADTFHVSVAYMSFLFKKHINENFSDYIWNLRFDKSKELLLYTDFSIDEISLKVGYENPSSFRRKFKQATNITPSQYRKHE